MHKENMRRQNRSTDKTQAGKCKLLKAVTVTRTGAFMAMPPGRDLLVPVSQQLRPIKQGEWHVVYLFLDPDNQLVGSTKLHRFLDERAGDMEPGQAVDLMIVSETSLGYKAVIDGTHLGLLYKDEVFVALRPGEQLKAYVKTIRSDGKIDLTLQAGVSEAREELSQKILDFLKASGGTSTLTDYSPPEAIYQQYGVSKGNYKKALGKLYKQRKIKLSREKVTLLEEGDQ
jgi:predicted RNA-binding protein (virulence factor B family)